jgi:hypothetical protein
VIVSNSRRGWVNFSSERFMPRLHALLAQQDDNTALPRAKQRVEVVYARALYGATTGADEKGSPLDWKVRVGPDLSIADLLAPRAPLAHASFQYLSIRRRRRVLRQTTAFAAQIRRLASNCDDADAPLELISIGDSDAERIAACNVCSPSAATRRMHCRSVKLQPKLTARKLCHAQRLVASHLPKLLASSDMKIDLHLSVARKRKASRPSVGGGSPMPPSALRRIDSPIPYEPQARSPLGTISNGLRGAHRA